MKKIIGCFALIILLSCKKDTVKPINGIQIADTVQSVTVDTINWQADKKGLITEDELSKAGVAIEKSNPDNRKKLLYDYLTYADKVDGATAEAFIYFIYHYENEHPKDFYPILTEKDTAFIRQWAEHAAVEFTLGVETHADAEALIQDMQDHNKKRSSAFNDEEKRLFDLYNEKLEKAAWKIFNSPDN